MIRGIGLDVLTLPDIARSLKSPGFRRQVFSLSEQQLYDGKPVELAKVFSLKEAWVKALGTGRIGGIEFHEIEWLSQSCPTVSGGARAAMQALFVTECEASAHLVGDVVMALVILSGTEAEP